MTRLISLGLTAYAVGILGLTLGGSSARAEDAPGFDDGIDLAGECIAGTLVRPTDLNNPIGSVVNDNGSCKACANYFCSNLGSNPQVWQACWDGVKQVCDNKYPIVAAVTALAIGGDLALTYGPGAVAAAGQIGKQVLGAIAANGTLATASVLGGALWLSVGAGRAMAAGADYLTNFNYANSQQNPANGNIVCPDGQNQQTGLFGTTCVSQGAPPPPCQPSNPNGPFTLVTSGAHAGDFQYSGGAGQFYTGTAEEAVAACADNPTGVFSGYILPGPNPQDTVGCSLDQRQNGILAALGCTDPFVFQ